jgi:hypothetical protein
MNIPINFIFTVYWANTDLRDGKNSYMNIVYTVTLVDEIAVEVTASMNPADVARTLTLDAQSTTFAQSGSSEGIMFRWKCPSMMQEYCD